MATLFSICRAAGRVWSLQDPCTHRQVDDPEVPWAVAEIEGKHCARLSQVAIQRALLRAPGSRKRPAVEAGVSALRHKSMPLLTWVLISLAQEMWATELRPLMEHAIEPLMATKRATSASNVTPVAGPPSRQKGDGPWCR